MVLRPSDSVETIYREILDARQLLALGRERSLNQQKARRLFMRAVDFDDNPEIDIDELIDD